MRIPLKLVVLLFAFVLLAGCKKESVKDFEGSWIDRQDELQTILIETEKGQYVMRGYWGDFQISVKDNRFPVVFDSGKEYPILLDRKNEVLSFNGKKYIRSSEAMKPKFAGKWLDESGATHWIQAQNGMSIWDIYTEDGQVQRYWPKFREGKYTFTYNNEELWFSLEGSTMVDSNGNTYSRIE